MLAVPGATMIEGEKDLPGVLVRHRYLIQGLVDCLMWPLALFAATLLRFEFLWDRIDWSGLAVLSLATIGIQAVGGLASGLYLGRWQYGSFEEVSALVRVTFLALVVALIVNQIPAAVLAPASAVVGAGAFALVAQTSTRYLWRLQIERGRRPTGERSRRVVVAGAGSGAEQLVRIMTGDPTSPYLPVALLDDDPAKARLGVKGVRVQGRLTDLGEVAADHEADAVVVAIPSAGAPLIRSVTADAHDRGLDVFVVPSVSNLLTGRVDLADVRPVSPVDLLGRRVIDTDVDRIGGYLSDRRVLVTGAGGSIGAELCRQIDRYEPASLVMLDRDESALHEVQLSMEGRALLDNDELVVADIRDRARIQEVFDHHRPDVVFHAAALKHLTLLEMHPEEAVKTNVWGTQHVLEAATATGVERFVNISTDKAADPTSVLGYTKRLAERLTAACCAGSDKFDSVRFGNVLGSRGSVLTAFREQVARGGPVTVTAPDVTRYFMLIEEAVQLVIQAGALDGPPGGAMVLDMGSPVSIRAMAEALIAEDHRDIDIVYTGLRPGEKRHEVLLGQDERPTSTGHELITVVDVPPLWPEELASVLAGPHRDTTGLLAKLATATTGSGPVSSGESLGARTG